MHATADTEVVIGSGGAGRRVMRGVRRRYNEEEQCSGDRELRGMYYAAGGLSRDLDAA